MNRWSEIFKSFVVLFCEGVWLYYGVRLFAGLQWDVELRPEPFYWFLAGVKGYFLFLAMGRKGISPNVSFVVYALFWGLLIHLNLKAAPEEVWNRWGSVIALLGAVSFLYVRGMYFAQRGVTRGNMLLRLEGNMMFYLLFALINEVRSFADFSFHIVFACALALSLVGIMFTLQQGHEEDGVTTRKAGNETWGLFPFVLCLMVGGGLSVLFLRSYVKEGLTLFLTAAKEGIWAAARGVYSFLVWLMELLPDVELETMPPEPAEPQVTLPPGEHVLEGLNIPVGPILFGLAFIIVLALLVVLSRKLVRGPAFSSSSGNRTGKELSLREWMLRLIRELFRRMVYVWIRIRRNFPGYYPLRLYYDFYRLLKWGKKNNIPRMKQETPREYGLRLVKFIPKEQKAIGETIRHLCESFASVYYSGGKVECRESFQTLFRELKGVSLWKQLKKSPETQQQV